MRKTLSYLPKFNVQLLEKWLADHKPYALNKLADKSGISVSGIYKIRNQAHIPERDTYRKLAKVLNPDGRLLVVFEPDTVETKKSA